METRHVHIDDRHFIVKSDELGPRVVYERVLWNAGHPFLEHWHNRTYWHRDHAGSTRGLINRILNHPTRI